jgi:membrane protease YdiL (CAAX protease family)
VAVPDLAVNAETAGLSRPHKLRSLAVVGGMVLLAYLPAIAASFVYTRNGHSTNDTMISVVLPTICGALMIVIPVLMVRRAPGSIAFDCVWVRWTRSEFGWFWLLPLGVVISVIPIAVLQYWLGLPLEWSVEFEHGFYQDRWLLVGMTMYAILLGPIAEEFFWRGYVQGTLTRVFHPTTAIVIQSVFFGLMHFRPALGTAGIIATGLIFGVWCWRRKTLVPVIIAHMMLNGVAFSIKWADWRELVRIKPVHDYVAEFMELSKPLGYEPNDDARQEYDKAFQLAVEPTKEIEDLRQRYPTHWSDEEKTHVESWLASNAQAIKLAKEGSRKLCYWPEYVRGRDLIAPLSPVHGKEMRWLGIALAKRALVNAAKDRHGEAIDDVLTCYRIGRHLVQCRDTLSQLIGVSIYGLASQTARAILYHEDVSLELLTDLQEQLEKLAAECPIRFDVRTDQFLPLETVQRLFTDDGHGGGHIPKHVLPVVEQEFGEWLKAADSDVSEWSKLDRRSVTEDVRQYYHAFGEATSLAPWDYERNAGEVKSTIERIVKSDPLVRVFSLNVRVTHLSARARADLDSVITILAILRYRADRREFPESLELLVGEGYLKKTPRDPFGSDTLIYTRTTDSFLLYSWGMDFDDDRGIPTTSEWGEGEQGGDQVFWPVSERD